MTDSIGYQRKDWSTPWLQKRADEMPAAPAVEFDGEITCYADLVLKVESFVRALSRLGVKFGDIVAVDLPNGLPIACLSHAAFAGDFILLPINQRLSSYEIEFQLRDSGARFFIHEEQDAEADRVELDADVKRIKVRELDGRSEVQPRANAAEWVPGSRPIRLCSELDLDAPRFILYTSGTTGQPKGVLLSAANFLASARGSAALLGARATDRTLLCMPIFHVGGLSILLRSVLAGSSIVLHKAFSAEAVCADLDARRVTGISVVANMLSRILAVRGKSKVPTSLECVLLGGGPAPASVLEAAGTAGLPVAITYGLTEAASQVATRLPTEPEDAGLRPLPGTRIEIRDEAGQALGPGRPGQICVRSDTVMSGYWNRPEASASALCDGWLHTGDIGMLDREGRLHVHDRRSDLIVSGGENVYPAELEQVLLEHPAIAEAGVAGRADETYGARPVAWLVADGECLPDTRDLVAHCRSKLAAYKCPVKFFWVTKLPRTATGKLLRRDLGRGQLE